MTRDLSLPLVAPRTLQRLRLVLLTATTLAAQCVALTDFRLSTTLGFLLGAWAATELALKWLSE